MSTIAYASLTNVRDDADPTKKRDATKPGVSGYVDAVAALVPAEVLSLHALLLTFTTQTTKDAAGMVITVITEPATLKYSFWALIGLTIIVYLSARGRAHANKLDALRLGIPPVAFVAWTMLQKATAFDAAFPGMRGVPRAAVALFAAVLLGVLAAWLAKKASESKPPTPASATVPPAVRG